VTLTGRFWVTPEANLLQNLMATWISQGLCNQAYLPL